MRRPSTSALPGFLSSWAIVLFILAVAAPGWAQMGAPHPPGVGASPHGMATGAPPQDRSVTDPSLPAGVVRVEVLGASLEPLSGISVTLVAQFQSVAQGNSETEKRATTDAQGVATFTDLDTALRFTYGVRVIREGAVYTMPSFRLGKTGQRVTMHTYPVTADPKEAFVGLQGFVTVRVKEDLLRVDTVYRVINMSRKTYKPAPLSLRLPSDAQGFEAEIIEGDSGFRAIEGGVELKGTFPPGQKDLPFSFHVPNQNEERQSFSMALPPHVVDMNVLTEMSPGMGLTVTPGFEAAVERTGRDDKKVLLTRRVLRAGDSPISSITVELSGLPVIGPGRWWAVLGAAVVALLGVIATFFRKEESEDEKQLERERARQALLEEMSVLHRAMDEGVIGPRTFEQTKREILNALARLEPFVE